MKKLLFIIGVLSGGGAERVLILIANEFAERGYDVSILTITPDMERAYYVSKKINIITLPRNEKRHIQYSLQTIKDIRKIVKKGNYDEIISFLMGLNVYVLLSTLFMKIPVIVSERCDPGSLSDRAEKLIYLFSKFIYLKAKKIVFQTEDVKKYYAGIIRKKSCVIPNPVNPDLPEKYPDEMREKIIVSAGRLSKQKNYPLLLKSFAKFNSQCPEYRLQIYGKGELLDELKALCKTLKIDENVQFPGYVNNVDDYIQKAAMFVMSSDYEGISNTMIEALAMGVPTICTDCPVGGARLMIKHGVNGLLVPVGDVDALADAMLKIACNPGYAAELGQEALKVKQEYSIKSIADKWEFVIQDQA